MNPYEQAAQLVEQAADEIEPGKKNPQGIVRVNYDDKYVRIFRELAGKIRNLESPDTTILSKKEQCS